MAVILSSHRSTELNSTAMNSPFGINSVPMVQAAVTAPNLVSYTQPSTIDVEQAVEPSSISGFENISSVVPSVTSTN